MAHNLKPDLEPEAQLLRQQIAELTKANVALQTELAERRRTEVALRTEVARVYQELNKLKRAEQLARRQTAALTHTLEELTKDSELNRFLGQVLFAITEQLDVPLSTIWLVDSNKENAWLHMMCHEGQILTGEQQLGHPNATMPDPIADSRAWQAVYSARRPVIHDNIANKTRPHHQRADRSGIRAPRNLPERAGRWSRLRSQLAAPPRQLPSRKL